ncbi:MAG TPA: MFS transporter [Polyangiaceae bacterium]|jgi:EmrB/QacA subfamily drug resistance transporter|nr:MFS transporter [Polyangiaceae bacterium]
MNNVLAPPLTPARKRLILLTCCTSLLMVSMDVTIVNVALPSIRKDFHAAVSSLQWTIDAYTVVVASFLMLAGSTGDRLGRRRTFQTGLFVFSLGSLLCSLAPSIFWLVVFRMMQALGGAMLNPVAMSIVVNVFTDPKERARALGVWSAVFGVSLALGPVVGGALTQALGWRSIFWINVPIGALAFLATARLVPESRAPRVRRFDGAGQIFVVIGLAALVSGVIEGPRAGWFSPLIVGLLASAAVAVVGLVWVESRRREPLIDLRFFRSMTFSSATLLAVLAFASFSAFLFLNSLYLQEVRLLPARAAGLCTFPAALTVVACSPLSGRLVARGQTRAALAIAGTGLTLGALSLTQLEAHTPLAWLLVTYAVFGVGLGMVNVPITNTAVSGMPLTQAGVAAAVASTSRQVGASLGVAFAGSIVGSAMRGPGHPDFATATHAMWWLVVGCGMTVAVLAFVSTSEWARATARRVAYLLEEPGGPQPGGPPPRNRNVPTAAE